VPLHHPREASKQVHSQRNHGTLHEKSGKAHCKFKIHLNTNLKLNQISIILIGKEGQSSSRRLQFENFRNSQPIDSALRPERSRFVNIAFVTTFKN